VAPLQAQHLVPHPDLLQAQHLDLHLASLLDQHLDEPVAVDSRLADEIVKHAILVSQVEECSKAGRLADLAQAPDFVTHEASMHHVRSELVKEHAMADLLLEGQATLQDKKIRSSQGTAGIVLE